MYANIYIYTMIIKQNIYVILGGDKVMELLVGVSVINRATPSCCRRYTMVKLFCMKAWFMTL